MKSKPKNIEELVNNVVESFNASVDRAVRQAANDGARIGGEEMKQKLFATLANGGVLNDEPARRRSKATKGVVQCPVPGCKRPGIRPLHNFCQVDYDKLTPKKRDELRKKQIDDKKKQQEPQKAANG